MVGCVSATTGTETATEVPLDFEVINERAGLLNISKGRLAELAGVDRTTMWRYRQGMMPSLEIARRLAAGLRLSVDEITGKGNPTPPPPSGPSTPPPPTGPKAGE
jgi:transcriptional regulator with XRE-family HTH domain